MLLTIISILGSGIIAFFVAKWQMKKNEITHFLNNTYDIGKGLSNKFPELHLQYKGEYFDKNAKVIEGGFMNTGRNDIVANKENLEINLIFPEGCSLRGIRVDSSTKKLKIETNKTSDREVVFLISDLFKSNEYFYYTAILESDNSETISDDELIIDQRIPNTKKIRKTYLKTVKKSRKRKTYKRILAFGTIFLVAWSVIMFLFQPLRAKEYKKDTHERVLLFVTPQSNYYALSKIDGDFSIMKVSPTELNNRYEVIPEKNYTPIPGILFLFCAFLYGWLLSKYYLGRGNYILRVIKNNEDSEGFIGESMQQDKINSKMLRNLKEIEQKNAAGKAALKEIETKIEAMNEKLLQQGKELLDKSNRQEENQD